MNTNMNSIDVKEKVIRIVSITAQPIEMWAANWNRCGKLQLASHPKTSTDYIVSKIIREAHNGEKSLRIDCWNKVHRKYPAISYTFFEDVFHDLIQQIYFNLKSDLYCYRM